MISDGINLGNTLEELVIGISAVWLEIPKIQEHCRHRKSIDVEHMISDSSSLSEFLASYGDQLEYPMHNMDLNSEISFEDALMFVLNWCLREKTL